MLFGYHKIRFLIHDRQVDNLPGRIVRREQLPLLDGLADHAVRGINSVGVKVRLSEFHHGMILAVRLRRVNICLKNSCIGNREFGKILFIIDVLYQHRDAGIIVPFLTL